MPFTDIVSHFVVDLMQTFTAEKIVQVREELGTITANWRKEWKDQVAEWSKDISIVTIGGAAKFLGLPTDFGPKCFPVLFPQDAPISFVRNFNDAIDYHSNYVTKYLSTVPLNLVILIYRHLVIAFGGNFSPTFTYSGGEDVYYNHYLRVRNVPDYKRHRRIIHQSCPHLFVTPDKCNDDEKFDGWEFVTLRGFQLDDELKVSSYSKYVLQKFKTYQMSKMIDNYFLHRTDSLELTQIAKKLSSCLISMTSSCTRTIVAPGYGFHLALLEGRKSRELVKNLDFSIQDNANCKDVTNNWNVAVTNPQFVNFLGNLTIADVNFIVSCFVHSECDAEDSAAALKDVVSFPSADDDFTNFDSPHLRGLLSKTVLSRELAKYELGKEEIASGTFAAVAPSALVHIVDSYYAVDFPQFD